MRLKTLGYAFLSFVIVLQSTLICFLPRVAFAEGPQETPKLIISAVQITGGTGKTQQDFIEFFNPTNQAFNLNGVRLVKRTALGTTDSLIKSWTEDTLVEPYHFYLWANSNFTEIPITPDLVTSGTLADNNGIALRNGENDVGEIIDSVSWGSTANGFGLQSLANPSANQSLVRTDLFAIQNIFSIQVSTPRNSTINESPAEIAPEEVPPPTDEPPSDNPPPTDDSPPADQPPVNDSGSGTTPPTEEPPPVIKLRITELLPNPIGSDSGFEQIEIQNQGTETVNLEGYKLDDIASNQLISSNAYVLPNLTIDPNSYLAITIPAGKFSLNNTGGEAVSLLNSQNQVLDTVIYEDSAPEGKSYSLFSSGWEWSNSTFGEDNGAPPVSSTTQNDQSNQNDNPPINETKYDNSGLKITEIFPQPQAGENEFIEIYNAGSDTAQLSEVAVYVGDRKKILPDYELQAGEFYVVEKSFLPVQLRNSGQIIKLQQDQTIIDTVEYPTAIEGASFAQFEDGFLWTTTITKGAANILQIPELIKKSVIDSTPKITAKVPITIKKATTKVTVTKPTIQTPVKAVASTNKTITPINSDNQDNQNSSNSETAKKQQDSLAKIIAMGVATIGAGVIALYKFVLAST